MHLIWRRDDRKHVNSDGWLVGEPLVLGFNAFNGLKMVVFGLYHCMQPVISVCRSKMFLPWIRLLDLYGILHMALARPNMKKNT